MKFFGLKPLRAQSDEMLHLDLLRFVASCAIVVHHSKEFFYGRLERASADQHSAGLALFVDLFFAISGYVIAYIYSNKVGSWRGYGTFIQRRIGRLAPLHWLTFVLAIGLWLVLIRAGATAAHVPSFKPQCLVETVFLAHAIIPCGGMAFNGVSWSISAEMAAYLLLFPAFAFIGLKQRYGPMLLAVALLAVLLGLGISKGDLSVTPWLGLPPVVRAVPSFLFGIGLWFCSPLVQRLPKPQWVLAVSLPALCVAMFTITEAVILLSLVYIVVVSAVASDLQGKAGALVRRGAPLGQLTYSMYMWHPLVILVFMNVIGDKFLHDRGFSIPILAAISYATILIGCYLSLQLIENPARAWIDSMPPFGKPGKPNVAAPIEAASDDSAGWASSPAGGEAQP